MKKHLINGHIVVVENPGGEQSINATLNYAVEGIDPKKISRTLVYDRNLSEAEIAELREYFRLS
jgi:hypothetical protein